MVSGIVTSVGAGTYFVHVLVVPRDDEFGVVEEMIDDASVGPGAVLGKEGKRCVPVEELELLASAWWT